MSVVVYTDARYDGRYCATVEHKPSAPDDPIPYLVRIYDAATDTDMESYWRGAPDEAQEALAYWITHESPEAHERETDGD